MALAVGIARQMGNPPLSPSCMGEGGDCLQGRAPSPQAASAAIAPGESERESEPQGKSLIPFPLPDLHESPHDCQEKRLDHDVLHARVML